jgi:hypothetical protein
MTAHATAGPAGGQRVGIVAWHDASQAASEQRIRTLDHVEQHLGREIDHVEITRDEVLEHHP